MTTAICPTRHPPAATQQFLDSFFACDPRPERLIMVVDQQPDTAAMLAGLNDPRIELVVNDENIGFFGSVNRGLELVTDEQEPVAYLQVDLQFARDWHAQASVFFARTYPDGLGLISYWDGIHGGANASQGTTTKRWLWVVFGEPNFPREYFRHFGDSELSARSKELGRYGYCEAARSNHDWRPVESRPNFKVNDYDVQNRRYEDWRKSGFNAAKARLASLNPQAPLVELPEPPADDGNEPIEPPSDRYADALVVPLSPTVTLAYTRHNTAAISFRGPSGKIYEGADTDALRVAEVEPGDVALLLASGAWKRGA